MKGVDDGVGAVSFGFRGERIDQQAGEQSADGGQQDDHPGAGDHIGDRAELFAAGTRRVIVGQVAEQHHVGFVEDPAKDQGADAGDDADGQAIQGPSYEIVCLHALEEGCDSAEL